MTGSGSLVAVAEFGLDGNSMGSFQRLYNNVGPSYNDSVMPQNYVLSVEDTGMALPGESQLGVTQQIGCHGKVAGGHLTVTIPGVSLPPHYIAIGCMQPLQSNSPLVYCK